MIYLVWCVSAFVMGGFPDVIEVGIAIGLGWSYGTKLLHWGRVVLVGSPVLSRARAER